MNHLNNRWSCHKSQKVLPNSSQITHKIVILSRRVLPTVFSGCRALTIPAVTNSHKHNSQVSWILQPRANRRHDTSQQTGGKQEGGVSEHKKPLCLKSQQRIERTRGGGSTTRGNATTSQGMGGKQDERRHQIGGGGASRGGVCTLRGQEVEVAWQEAMQQLADKHDTYNREGSIGQKSGGTLRGRGCASLDKRHSCWSTRGGRASGQDVKTLANNRWWRQQTIGAGAKQEWQKQQKNQIIGEKPRTTARATTMVNGKGGVRLVPVLCVTHFFVAQYSP